MSGSPEHRARVVDVADVRLLAEVLDALWVVSVHRLDRFRSQAASRDWLSGIGL